MIIFLIKSKIII